MSWPIGKPTGLEGIVPHSWLRRERWLRETDQALVILHPEPAALGHCIAFPKKHSPRVTECDPDALSAIGMLLPEVKRAVRVVTGYRDYGMILRCGKVAGQKIDHLYVELVPTIHTKPTFEVNWDPNNKKGKGQNDLLTKKAAHSLVSIMRCEMGMHHFDGFGCVLLETDRITVEFVACPASTGHMIISPKQVSPDLEDCDPIDFAACLWQIPKLTRALKKTINLDNFFAVILNGPDAGQDLPHLSVQLVPCSGRGPSVDWTQKFTLTPKLETEKALSSAVKQILGQEIITLALGSTTEPRESAWPRPLSRQGTNPVGTSSPALIRARSSHPGLDTWVMTADTQKGFKRPDSQGSSIAGMSPFGRPPSRMSTPGSLPASLPASRSATPGDGGRPGKPRTGGVFQRSAQQSMSGTSLAGTSGFILQERPPSRLSVLSGASSQGSAAVGMQESRRKERILKDLNSLLSF